MDNTMNDDSSSNAARISHGDGTKVILPPQTRDLALNLIAHETATGNASEPMELAGDDGFRSFLSRALALATTDAPSLAVVRVTGDGSLQGLDALERQIGREQVREGGVILITRLLGLLLTFVGEAMTSRLVASEVLRPVTSIPKSGLRTGFEVILNEVEQLKGIGARLEGVAEEHPPFTEALMTVAGNVRNIATVLAVLVTVRSPRPN
jgi:hypothetical protein